MTAITYGQTPERHVAVTYTTSTGEERSRLLPSTLAGAFVRYLRRSGAGDIVVEDDYLKSAGATSIRTEDDHA